MNQYDKYSAASNNTSGAYKLISTFDSIIKILNSTKIAAEKKDTLGKINSFNKVIDAFNVLKSSFNEEMQDHPLTIGLTKFYHSAMEKAAELNVGEFSIEETNKFIDTITSIRDALLEGEKQGKLM